jgi:hypothetical protein
MEPSPCQLSDTRIASVTARCVSVPLDNPTSFSTTACDCSKLRWLGSGARTGSRGHRQGSKTRVGRVMVARAVVYGT